MKDFNELIDKLIAGDIKQIEVDKSDFFQLREIIVERQDFKRFRGIAKQGGKVVYKYLEKERS